MVDGKPISLGLWDTAGQEKYKTITRAFYRRANGIIISYDITSLESFNGTKKWLTEINKNKTDNVPIVLAATKCDLDDRQVTTEEGYNFAKSLGCRFFETSAKDNIQVKELFMYISSEVHKRGLVTYPGMELISQSNIAPTKSKCRC